MPVDLNDADVKAAIAAEAKKLADAEVEGLKNKRDELLGENKSLKELKAKYEGIDPEEARKALAKQKKEGDDKSSPEELRAKIEGEFTPKLSAAEKERDEARAALNARIIDGDLTGALVEANVSKDLMKAAKALLNSSQKIEVTESGATVDGKPLGAFVKEWVGGEGKPFVAAGVNTGGGAGGGNGGGGASTDLSKMTPAQLAKHVSENGYTPPTAQR